MIGAFSDKCTSRLGKRRPFIIVSGLLTCLSMLGIAYAREIGRWLATLTSQDEGWIDEKVIDTYVYKHVYITDISLRLTPMPSLWPSYHFIF